MPVGKVLERNDAEAVEVDGRINEPQELKVEKRDGRTEEFDPDKISRAITMAWREVNGDVDAESAKAISDTVDAISSKVKSRYGSFVKISEIQNIVEHSLVEDAHWYDVARAYVDYRLEHDVKRAQLTDVNYAVKRFSSNDKSIMNENANKDSRQAAVRRDLLAGAVSKSFAFKALPKDVSNAFAKKDIHYHDADYSPFTTMNNCFARETMFITASGVKSFEDFEDGDEVLVLAPSGNYRHATVHNYGEQDLYDITMIQNGRSRRTITATRNHRWILRDGSETTNVQVGDVLKFPIGSHNSWKVEDIQPAHRHEDVWCLEVDDEHAFVLEGGIVTGNCSLPNYGGMLASGFNLGNAQMGSPKSIGTATSQVAQIMLDVAGNQYGGQTIDRADEMFAPYARKDYRKFLDEAKLVLPDGIDIDTAKSVVRSFKAKENENLHTPGATEIIDTPDESIDDPLEQQRDLYAKIRTRKAIYDAFQSLEYNLNSQHSSCGQVPFTSIGFGLGQSWVEREITRCILLVRIAGLGETHKTAIFPKLLYTVKHGVNSEPTDPNYDLKQLALECTSKRMYPDILFYENIVNITGDFKAPMGCVVGNEVVTWKDKSGIRTDSIRAMWDTLSRRYPVKHQGTDGDDWYIDIPEGDITIKDSHTGEVEFVPVRRMVNNQPREWRRVKFSNGRTIECTPDHPFEIQGKGRVLADDLKIGDVTKGSIDEFTEVQRYVSNGEAWLRGFIMCDGCLHENSEVLVSFAAEDEDEIENRIMSMYPENRLRHKLHNRGRKGVYKEIAIKDKFLRNQCIADFGGMNKTDRSVPSWVFNATREERLAFLGGAIDADGYISNKQMVQIGSTNKTLAIGQMLLANSLGLNAKMYANYYKTKDDYEFVRYAVYFVATQEVVDNIVCKKKASRFDPNHRIAIDEDSSSHAVTEIVAFDSDERSYDVTTASDFFDFSGIVSHNCRSFLQAWQNPETGENEVDGRMNLGVVTVNLPRIALESRDKNGKPSMKKFWRIFEHRMDVCHHALQFRIKRCMEAVPESAPSLWQFGAFGRLGKDGDVASLMRNGRATASLGYVGVYETVAVFYGRDWVNDDGWDTEAYDFAKAIMQRMNDCCHEWEEQDTEHVHYSVYGTPAESTSSSFINADKAKFGIIKGITDNEWYTNSFHRPTWISGNGGWEPEDGEEDVRKRPTFYHAMNGGVASKLDFEAPLEKLSPGGNVVMIDLPRLVDNTRALEAVWDYAHDVGVGYLLSNCPIDQCGKCGFRGDAIATDTGYKCPECGNTDPETLDCVKRVCGYLGEPIERPMVKGRDHEIKSRKLNMAGRTGEVMDGDGVDEVFYSTDRL